MPTPLYWRRCIFGAVILIAALPATVFAQWPTYRDPSIPRTPDGKPNMSAPAPKAPDGKPDLSGMWDNYRAPAPPPPPSSAQAPAAARPPGGPNFNTFTSNDDFLAIVKRSPFWNLGRFVQRRTAVHTVGRGTAPAARGRQQQG